MRFFYFALALLGLLILLLAMRAARVLVNRRRFEKYWLEGLALKPAKNAIKLVALGDSISVGVGAASRVKGLIGLATAYIEKQTGRPVYAQNYSRSGATANEVADIQLPKTNLAAADIILLEIGANDSFKRTPEQYGHDISRVIAALPLEKTVIADLPYVKIRQPFQAELEKVLQNKSVIRADLSSVFQFTKSSWRITASDFFHPNDAGYLLWFKAFQPGIDEVLRRSNLLKTETK